MTTDYAAFLQSKRLVVPSVGGDVNPDELHPSLKDFQRALVVWALRKGRAALWADTGLGKAFMSMEWARLASNRALIVAPLAVAKQFEREAAKFKIETEVAYARRQDQAPDWGIALTNYEMVEHFDPDTFGAVVLDESSILKAHDAKTRGKLIEMFRHTPYRLCCTATPAPNDRAELANHAEFLGIMSRAEMLASFFVHDDQGWRLKGHAHEAFYRWLSSWAMSLRKPSNLGYSDNGYDLPPLSVELITVSSDYVPEGQLFFTALRGITDRTKVRRGTLQVRCERAAALVHAEPDEPWLLWCGLNDESDLLAKLLPAAEVVEGTQSVDDKTARIERFLSGEARWLITKPKIAGHGLNLQHCARQVFVGLSDSWEMFYQAIRRSWRFGQTRPVQVYVVLSEQEDAIWANVQQKEQEADRMADELVRHAAQFEQAELGATVRQSLPYDPRVEMTLPRWLKGV